VTPAASATAVRPPKAAMIVLAGSHRMSPFNTIFVQQVKHQCTKSVLAGLFMEMYGNRMSQIQDPDAGKAIIDWVTKGLAKPGKTNTGLAKAMGVGQPRVAEIKTGTRQVKATELPKMARYLEEPIPAALTPYLAPTTMVGLKGSVRAGYWADPGEETDFTGQYVGVQLPEVYRDIPRKFAVRVEGASMNRLYPDGTILVCASLYDLRETEPIAGKKYIVRRTRRDGAVETTVKEVAPDHTGRVWLWPRSDDPEHQSPIPLEGVEGETIEATARVIWSMKPE
jgi:hypothetical protein